MYAPTGSQFSNNEQPLLDPVSIWAMFRESKSKAKDSLNGLVTGCMP